MQYFDWIFSGASWVNNGTRSFDKNRNFIFSERSFYLAVQIICNNFWFVRFFDLNKYSEKRIIPRYYLKHGLTSWFALFSIIFCLNSNFLFLNLLSIPSDSKIKWSFGANSREENKSLNLDYLAGPNTWVINVKYVADFNQCVFWRPLNYQIFRPTQKWLKNKPWFG